MLGRYVAGTLLVLGVAMLVAPDDPKPTNSGMPEREDVARPEPEVRAAPTPEVSSRQMATQEAPAPVVAEPAPAVSASPEGAPAGESVSGIEAAVAAALALDSTDTIDAGGDLGADPGTMEAAPETEAAADENPQGVFEGLGNPEAFSAAFEPGGGPAADSGEPAVDTEIQPAVDNLFRVTGSRVNVRAGPSTDFDVVGQVSLGDAVEVIGEGGGNWVEIQIAENGTTGFMSRNFLSPDL